MRAIWLGTMIVGLFVIQACAAERPPAGKQPPAEMVSTPARQSSAATNEQILLEKIKADKKLLVATNMELTDAEAAQFWPLYDAYQRGLEPINARLGRTIMDYAEAYEKGPLPDSTASHLLEEALAVNESEVALNQSFAKQLRQVLPAPKAARYLQIEHKIRALVNLELARAIPLAY